MSDALSYVEKIDQLKHINHQLVVALSELIHDIEDSDFGLSHEQEVEFLTNAKAVLEKTGAL